jgi:hypothetical protein
MGLFFLACGALFLYCGSSGAFTGPGIGTGPLSMARQPLPVPQPSVGTKIHEPFDIHGIFRPQLTLYLVIIGNNSTDIVDFGFGQLSDFGIIVNVDQIQNFSGRGTTDTEYICQPYFNPLVFW